MHRLLLSCAIAVCHCAHQANKRGNLAFFSQDTADSIAREQWFKAISRKDWIPNSTSNYSVVRSLHFETLDFKDNYKKRQLKAGVVPPLFCGYPSYMQKAPATTRSDASI